MRARAFSVAVAAVAAFSPVAQAQVIVGTNPTISTLTTGTVLDVSPAVSADGRYVNVGVRPSFSSLEGMQTFNLTNPAAAATPFRPAQVGKVIFVDHDAKLLAMKVEAMALKDLSLKDATKKLAAATKSNLVLGIRGLEQAGVDVGAPHTFAIEGGTMKEALLGMVKVAAPETDMVITSGDGVVQVMSQAQADTAVVTRTYYLEDLLANVPRFVSKDLDLKTMKNKSGEKKGAEAEKPIPPGPAGVLPPAVAVVSRGKAAAGVSAESRSLLAEAEKPKVSYSTSITEIITSAVRPEIWKVNGGKIGEIAVVGDHVTVTAPESVQALLDGPKHYDPNAVPMYVGYGTP